MHLMTLLCDIVRSLLKVELAVYLEYGPSLATGSFGEYGSVESPPIGPIPDR